MGKHLRHITTGLTMSLPFERRFHQRAGLAGSGGFDSEIDGLAVPLFERGFVIEGVHLAHAAIEEHLNDAPDFRLVMKSPVEFSFRRWSLRGRQKMSERKA